MNSNNKFGKAKSVAKYKEFIDGLVKQKKSVKSGWVLKRSYPHTETNKKINGLLSELSDNQISILADMLNEVYVDGMHDTLAYIDNLMDSGKLNIIIDSISINNNDFEKGLSRILCKHRLGAKQSKKNY